MLPPCFFTHYFAVSGFLVSLKTILLTMKNTTMDTPPLRTVVPILYSQGATKCPATAAQMQLMELTTQVTTQKASRYHSPWAHHVALGAEHPAALDEEVDDFTNEHGNI